MTRGIMIAVVVAGVATAAVACGSTYDDNPSGGAVTPATNAGAAPTSAPIPTSGSVPVSMSASSGGTTQLAAPVATTAAAVQAPSGPVATPKNVNGVQVFSVTGTKEVTFRPAALAAKPGRVRVDYTVESQSPPHDFVLPMIATAQTDVLSPGEKASLSFTVNAKGTYQIICTVHPGMKGTLTVS